VSDTPRTKRDFYEQAVKELALDTRDTFTNLFAHACALVDHRDQLKRECAELRAQLASAVRGECHDAAEQSMGCYRAVKAENALASARREERERCAKLIEDNVPDLNNAGKLLPLNPVLAKHRDVVRGSYADAIRALPDERT